MAKPSNYSVPATCCQLRLLAHNNDVAGEAAALAVKNVRAVTANDASSFGNSEPERSDTGFCNLRILIRLHA
jgi:hypothetical protein